MSRKDTAWILVRCAGLWMLIQALIMVPTLVTALPGLIQMLISWDITSISNWLEILSRGVIANAFGVVSKTVIYFTFAGWLLTRGECLMRLIESPHCYICDE